MKKMTIFFGILAMLMTSEKGNAQSLVCTATPPGTPSVHDELTHSLVKTPDGNMIFIGKSSANNGDVLVSKVSPSCGVLWTQTWNGSGLLDQAMDVATDLSGNVFVTGATMGSLGNTDIFLLKYNTNGVFQFAVTFAGTYNDKAFALALSGTSVYVTGFSMSNTTTVRGVTISFSQTNGSQNWISYYTQSTKVTNYSVCTDPAGNVYVAGETKSNTITQNSLIHTLKYSSAGAQLWAKNNFLQQTTLAGLNYPNRIVCDLDGVIVGGTGYNNKTAGDDFEMFKYSFAGVQAWATSYNWTGTHDVLRDIYVDKGNGRVIATGGSQIVGQGANQSDVTTIVLNSATGVLGWSQHYNGAGNQWDYGMEIDIDCNGQPYIGCKSQQVGNTNYQYLLLKYSAVAGALTWAATYTPAGSFADLNDVVVMPNSVFVSGTAGGPSSFKLASFNGVPSGLDCAPTRLSGISEQVDSKQITVYPNPSTGFFHLTSDQSGTAKVYDLQGKLFKSFEVHENENDFDLSMFENGIYFLVLTDANGEGISKQRIVINK